MTLYHYTNSIGLKGILEHKEIWASDFRFLNDPSEFRFGWNLMTNEISRYRKEIEEISIEAWMLIESHISHIETADVYAFVGSLSEEGDLLSQWRGYNGGKGFVVAFNENWLLQRTTKQGFSLVPISYDEKVQQESASGAVKILLRMLSDLFGDPNRVSETVSRWWHYALKSAFAFKDKSFSEEKEKRLVFIDSQWPATLKTRFSSRGLIPYIPYKLNLISNDNVAFRKTRFGIEKIIVGPALDSKQLIAVDALLNELEIDIEVEKSVIPYIAE